jgi:hypothetical protein
MGAWERGSMGAWAKGRVGEELTGRLADTVTLERELTRGLGDAETRFFTDH